MHRQFLFVLLTIAILASCTEKGSQPDTTPVMPQPASKVSQPAAPEPQQVTPEKPASKLRRVKRVIDGSTIELDGGEIVRLIGVDCPEVGEPLYEEAKTFMEKWVGNQRFWLEHESDEKRKDAFGRTLVYVNIPWQGPTHSSRIDCVLNEVIIREGWGKVYTEYPFKYMEKYRELEREAREAGRGLWASLKNIEDGSGIHRSDEPPPTPEQKAKACIVYITKTGKKYHRGSCSSLKKSKIPISLEDAKKQGYTPCSRCKPPE